MENWRFESLLFATFSDQTRSFDWSNNGAAEPIRERRGVRRRARGRRRRGRRGRGAEAQVAEDGMEHTSDTASCIPVAERIIALGTHDGTVPILVFLENQGFGGLGH
ncbi:hypothetical protein Scep_029138 [Stephania cephalantha]|uniref:Uncharacterized protein n=1 Tax=Stephania cephalantha TaxID=152367 RepID=A0AAP0E1J3_9MAGN